MIFYRADHTTLVIRLDSNEPLGILDTDYVEDYNGVDSQLTIYNTGTMAETPLVMVALPAETPGVPNDVFQGSVLLASLPDGDYQIRGRVRDVIGNHTIISAFATPDGDEDLFPFDFKILSGAFIPFPGRTYEVKTAPRYLLLDQSAFRVLNIETNNRVFAV